MRIKQLFFWGSIILAAGFAALFFAGVLDDKSVIPIDKRFILEVYLFWTSNVAFQFSI